MIGIFLSYIIALLLSVGGLVGSIVLIRKKQKGLFRLGSFFIGIISSVADVVVIMLLFRLTFNGEAYYNTVFFRTLVGLVYLALLSLVRFLAVKLVFFNRDREEQ